MERSSDGSQPYDPQDERAPVLLVMSDNGPQMSSGLTREFMALCRPATHYGRPGTRTDRAWIESFFAHLKGEFPHLDLIDDIDVLRPELQIRRAHYDGVRLLAVIGYVTSDQEHRYQGPTVRADPASAAPERKDSPDPADDASTTIATTTPRNPGHAG